MANLFAGVEPVEDEPSDAAIGDLLRRRADQRHLRTRRQGFLAAAASLALLAGGAAADVAVSQAPVVALAGQRRPPPMPVQAFTGRWAWRPRRGAPR